MDAPWKVCDYGADKGRNDRRLHSNETHFDKALCYKGNTFEGYSGVRQSRLLTQVYQRALRMTLAGEKIVDDLERYIEERKKRSAEFADGFEMGYEQFKIGVDKPVGNGRDRSGPVTTGPGGCSG